MFCELFCHNVSSVCDLIDLFSNVSVIDVYQSTKRSGLNAVSKGDFLLYATTYLVLLHYWHYLISRFSASIRSSLMLDITW